ncbi:hypothetical protein J437_LFUL001271 [Ladona fulva]|uniref:Uncharacterized protein n=1 Tax=Ladona fulva TaxID=123851 RepID=A0A8K0JTX8_LADFU|nr:hypothetical protein J437_LFUL001271 [Ladona fulva]
METASEKTDEWTPKYRNDSRQWIVCEEDQKTKWAIPNSTSKSTFVKPDENDFRPIGRRKKLFHRFFLNEVQVEPTGTDKRPIPTYRTEYMENFNQALTKNEKDSHDKKALVHKLKELTDSTNPNKRYAFGSTICATRQCNQW